MIAIVAFSAISTVLFLISLYSFVYLLPENRCQMTYMFEYPEYLEISLPKKVKEAFPRYGLYVYGEGAYAARLRRGEFNGIPVLFIPGNAGSHRQVRSLASVSMTKTQRSAISDTPEFNYFSIDFDEELSGLYGGYLRRQTEFAAKCVHRIFSLYKNAAIRPASLIIVGHSMGGIVARGLFLTEGFPTSLVNIVITLAAAHSAPVAMFDAAFDRYYAELSDFWFNNATTSLSNITVVSIGGGVRDVMVRSDLTVLERRPESAASTVVQNQSGFASFETTTTDIPYVWASTDHLCIVWCKQLVLTIVRALFDTVQSASGRGVWNENVSYQRSTIRYHFFERNDWQSNAQAVKDHRAMLDESDRAATQLLSKLASVIRSNLEIMPSLSLWYICSTLIHENSSNGKSILSAIGRVIYLICIPWLFIFWRGSGGHGSSVVVIVLSLGLFSLTNILANVVALMGKCCWRSTSTRSIGTTRPRDYIRLLIILLSFLGSSFFGWTTAVLFLLLSTTVITRVFWCSAASTKNTLSIIQTCLTLFALMAPWTVVLIQNTWHGGHALPYDPSFAPTLLWICGETIALLIRVDFPKPLVTIAVGLLAMIFCTRLYSTAYCCGFLLGFYSRAYDSRSSRKVD